MEDAPKNVRLPRIAILGTGSMGGAILSGLLGPGVQVDGGIRVTTRTAESASRLTRDGVVAAATEHAADANRAAVAAAEVVILAVKPMNVLALASEVGPALGADSVVVSVAAGVTTEAIERVLPGGTQVVRAMPNTPATIGRGVTGVSAGSAVTVERLALVRSVFSTVGTVHEVPEAQLDALTAISGSGPAYLFYFAEKLADAGVAAGLDAALAEELAVETVRGAAELLATSPYDAEELRRRVTSPRGTTEQAIGVLDSREFGDILVDAVRAAKTRAGELARQFSRPDGDG